MRVSFLQRFPLILLIIGVSFSSLMAQTTQGTEFFAGFMKNGYRGCNGSSSNESLRFIASAKRNCTVTISNPQTTWSTMQSIPANGLVNIIIPPEQVYTTNSEVVENMGLLITATDTISLFIANEATNSFDASFVLPTSCLLDEYVLQNHTPMLSANNSLCPNNNKSVFMIVATEDSTTVDITVKATTVGGKQNNVPFSITLQRGQTYQVMSNSGGTSGDFSGSYIKARDCKKIAVFNGNVLTSIPETLTNGLDHIFEQAMPVAYWGKEFVVTSSIRRSKGDFVKVTALEDLTQVRQDGTLLTTINAGESYTFNIPLNPGACYLESSKPVGVNLYQTTSEYDSSPRGDPSMVWISPVEQQIKEIVFGTFAAQNISNHYVNIVVRTSNIGSITLNGNGIPASLFSLVQGNPNYSFARVSILAGTHILKSISGFVAHVYGYGTAQGYAYSVGSTTLNLNHEVYLNDISSFQIGDNSFICQFDSISLKILHSNQYDSIFWDMGDGTKYFQDSAIVHQYVSLGNYTITNIVKSEYANCAGSLYDTLRITLQVNPLPIIEFEVTPEICKTGNGAIYSTVAKGVPPYTYHWSNGDTMHHLANLSEGRYNLVVTDQLGCKGSLYADMISTPIIVLNRVIIADDTCNESRGSITIEPSGGSGQLFYEWSTGDTNITRLSNLSAGTYQVLISDTVGCSTPFDIEVVASHLHITTLSSTPEYCDQKNGSIVLQISTPYDDMYTIHWGDRITVFPENALNNLSAGTYTISISVGFCSKDHTFSINEVPAPTAIIAPPSEFPIFVNDLVEYTDVSTGSPIEWYWQFGDGKSSKLQHPYHWYKEFGTYLISLWIKDAHGCVDSTEIEIQIIENTPLYVPNCIILSSENNSIFKPVMENPDRESYSMRIYDRWGMLVFYTNNYNGGWNGHYNGKPVPQDVYTYIIQYKDPQDNKIKIKNGSITILP